LPFLLQPAVPVIGDAIYFGCDTSALDSGFFSNIIFNYEASGNQTVAIEYWNGGAWAAVANLTDMTYGLDVDGNGKNSMSWMPSAAWATALLSAAIAGAPASAPTGYWIRIRFTAVSATPSLELDYYPFSNTWPYFDVCDDSIEGDYEALLKISEQAASSTIQSIIIGDRSLDRGADFDGYFNCADEQNSDFVTVALVSASTAFANDVLAATNRVITYAPGGVAIDEDVFYIRVMNNNYTGTYRLILFAEASAVSTSNFRIELEPYLVGATSYPIAYTPWVTIQSNLSNPYVDLGQITIPEDVGREPTVNGFNLLMHVNKDDLVNATWTFYQLVLIPNDEFALEAFDDNTLSGNPSCRILDYLYLDSAENNKYTTKIDSWSSTAKQGVYRGVTRGSISVPPRHALRFWHKLGENFSPTTGLRDSRAYNLMRVLLYDAERYIGLRGDR
jgi:hypothetical protein